MIALIRKTVSLLLVVCFVLPLSTCSVQNVEPDGKIDTTTTYEYGYKMIPQGWNDLKRGDLLVGAGLLLAALGVFFFPAACLKLKEKSQAILLFIASFPAGYFLYLRVFVFSTKFQYGGIIAMCC